MYQIKGIIDVIDDSDIGKVIKIISDNEVIDLVDFFGNYIGKIIEVSYWISDKPYTKEEIISGMYEKLYGRSDTSYESYCHCSWTYGCTSRCEKLKDWSITIGGHDFYDEIKLYDRKYIIIEIVEDLVSDLSYTEKLKYNNKSHK